MKLEHGSTDFMLFFSYADVFIDSIWVDVRCDAVVHRFPFLKILAYLVRTVQLNLCSAVCLTCQRMFWSICLSVKFSLYSFKTSLYLHLSNSRCHQFYLSSCVSMFLLYSWCSSDSQSWNVRFISSLSLASWVTSSCDSLSMCDCFDQSIESDSIELLHSRVLF